MRNETNVIRNFIIFLIIFNMPAGVSGQQQEFIVGLTENPPLAFYDESGNASGFYVDLLNYIADKENWKLVYVNYSRGETLRLVEEGEIDIVTTLGHQEPFIRRFRYPDERLINNWAVIYQKPGKGIESIFDLDGKSIAVLMPSSHTERLKELADEFDIKIQFVESDQFTTIAEMVAAGKVDCGLLNRLAGYELEYKYNIEPTTIIFNPIDVRIAASLKSDPVLMDRINAHLSLMKKDPDSFYYQSFSKWFGVKKAVRLPEWVRWFTYSSIIILVSFMLMIFYLRKTVKEKTSHLRIANEELKKKEEKFRDIFESANVWKSITEISGKIRVNKAFADGLGYSQDELNTKKWQEITPPEDIEHIKKLLKPLASGKSDSVRFEKRYIRKNGSLVWVDLSTVIKRDNDGKPLYFITTIVDITERKLAEEKILKANRLYFVISQINQAIVRVHNKDKILEEACRIAIEYGKFKMAWIGMVDEKTKLVTPVAYSGDEDGYLAIINVSVEYVPSGHGPTGTAIREGRHNVCDDIEKDPRMAPWKEEALKRGYRSSIALPIKHLGKVIGAFSIYSSVPHFFDEEEIRLLDEVTSDISFALDSIENTKKKQDAEAELEKHRFHLEEMVEERTSELERMNRLFIGRELKMKELKKRIAELEEEKGNK